MDINFSNEDVKLNNSKRIFLAGPTRRNSTFENSWRNEACKILKDLGFDGIVYVPEFSGFNIQFDYDRQVLWERKALENATIILFWIPRDLKDDMPGFTTNVEFGMYLARNPEKVILAFPKNADKMQYLDWLYTYETNKTSFHSLKEALIEAINS